MDERERLAEHPNVFFLQPGDVAGIRDYLRQIDRLERGERVLAASPPGEGNMNCTLRVVTDRRSFILKQSRPWVRKYPQIDAPWDRALVEARFYEMLGDCPELQGAMPRLLFTDVEARVLALEDLGDGRDLTDLYRGAAIGFPQLGFLTDYLWRLHHCFAGRDLTDGFANRAMRRLNHQHIFHVPLHEDLSERLDGITPGLADAAERLKHDAAYIEAVAELGEVYMRDRPSLVHGDFFPGSWLAVGDGARVIDPEFCFCGPPEFDLGTMIAHLRLARQGPDRIDRVLRSYRRAPDFSEELAVRFAGVEIMRRLIGVAQLPLPYGLDRKRELLALSRELLLERPAFSTL